MNIEEIRREVPALEREIYGKPLIYLDNAATTQTPVCVIDALANLYRDRHANVHRGVHCLSNEATDALEHTRRRVAAYINAPSHEQIIFTRGTTEAINLVASSYCQQLKAGDEILLTVMEHHSNIVPWQLAAQRHGLIVKAAPISDDGALDIEVWKSMITERTRIVSFCHVSNVLGTVNPVAQMAAYAHERGCMVCVDGAQGVPHYKVDVQALGADFYAFSAHKLYGPTGVGCLYGNRAMLEAMPPYQGGGEMIGHVTLPTGTTWAELPYKFEAGTPDFTAIGAFSAALDWVERLGIDAIEAHESALYKRCVDSLREKLPEIRIFGTTSDKCPVLSFLIGNAHHYDTGMLLDRLGIAVRTGHHCAQPLMHALGIEGTLRASFAAYNTEAEVDAFVAALCRIAPMLE